MHVKDASGAEQNVTL